MAYSTLRYMHTYMYVLPERWMPGGRQAHDPTHGFMCVYGERVCERGCMCPWGIRVVDVAHPTQPLWAIRRLHAPLKKFMAFKKSCSMVTHRMREFIAIVLMGQENSSKVCCPVVVQVSRFACLVGVTIKFLSCFLCILPMFTPRLQK